MRTLFIKNASNYNSTDNYKTSHNDYENTLLTKSHKRFKEHSINSNVFQFYIVIKSINDTFF